MPRIFVGEIETRAREASDGDPSFKQYGQKFFNKEWVRALNHRKSKKAQKGALVSFKSLATEEVDEEASKYQWETTVKTVLEIAPFITVYIYIYVSISYQ